MLEDQSPVLCEYMLYSLLTFLYFESGELLCTSDVSRYWQVEIVKVRSDISFPLYKLLAGLYYHHNVKLETLGINSLT